jgi:hypothetical protein
MIRRFTPIAVLLLSTALLAENMWIRAIHRHETSCDAVAPSSCHFESHARSCQDRRPEETPAAPLDERGQCVICKFLAQAAQPDYYAAEVQSEPLSAFVVLSCATPTSSAPSRIHHSRAPPSVG